MLRLVQKNPTLYLSQLLEMLPKLDGFHFQAKAANTNGVTVQGKEGSQQKEKEKEKDASLGASEDQVEEIFDFDDSINMNVQNVLNYLGHYPIYLDVLLNNLTRTAIKCGLELLYPPSPLSKSAQSQESKGDRAASALVLPSTSPR